jgi:hypothetical protein
MIETPERDEGGDEATAPQSPDTDRDAIEDEDVKQELDDAEKGLREQSQGH